MSPEELISKLNKWIEVISPVDNEWSRGYVDACKEMKDALEKPKQNHLEDGWVKVEVK